MTFRYYFIIVMLLFSALTSREQDFYKITGSIVDSKSMSPLPYAPVYLSGSKYCGTVSNDKGEFVLKIAKNLRTDSLKISYIGYKAKVISLKNLNGDRDFHEILLDASSILLNEFVVRPLDPLALIDSAIQRIPVNYDITPIMMTGFYQEQSQFIPLDSNKIFIADDTIRKEAVFEVYRSPYRDKGTKVAADDHIKLIAWRKKGEIKDTIVGSILGSLRGSLANNVLSSDPLKDVKHSFLYKKNRSNYVFKLTGISTYDDTKVYVITFDQKDSVEKQLYKGTIYIDVASMAFVAIDYALSPKGERYNSMTKFLFLGYMTNASSMQIRYKKNNDKWNVYFIQKTDGTILRIYRTNITSYIFRKLNPTLESISFRMNQNYEFVITDVDKENVVEFSADELFKSSSEVKTEINQDNEDIWGKYNYIKMP